MTTSEAAYQTVKNTYFPEGGKLFLGGIDGITQVWNDDILVGMQFPDRYSANRNKDVTLTFHEMGHFVTIRPNRVVREAFGFGGGIPDLSWGSSDRFYASPASLDVEAKAFAWEYLLGKTHLGLDVSVDKLVYSLRLTPDFHLYPGQDTAEKLKAVAQKTADYIDAFSKGPDFDTLWTERVGMLDHLLALENRRLEVLALPPVETVGLEPVFDTWSAELSRHGDDVTEAWVATITSEDEFRVESREFDTRQAAEKWVSNVRSFWPNTEPDATPSVPGI